MNLDYLVFSQIMWEKKRFIYCNILNVWLNEECNLYIYTDVYIS